MGGEKVIERYQKKKNHPNFSIWWKALIYTTKKLNELQLDKLKEIYTSTPHSQNTKNQRQRQTIQIAREK